MRIDSQLRNDNDLAQDLAAAQKRKGMGSLAQGKGLMYYGLEAACCDPFKGAFHVGAISPVAANQSLLLDEKRPNVELDLSARCRPASYHSAPAR